MDIYLNFQFRDVEDVVKIFEKYQKWFDVDLKFGRYVVDGCSYLGAFSLANHIVKVCPVPDTDEELKIRLLKELRPFGAYTGEEIYGES